MSNLASGQARPAPPSFDLSDKHVVVVGGKRAIRGDRAVRLPCRHRRTGAGRLGIVHGSRMGGVRSYREGKFPGTWACARHAAPHLLTGGSITFLTGGTGARAKLGLAAVTPTFAAVEALSRSLALELASIRVNTIRPGFIDTDFWDALPAETAEEIRAKVRANFPARRLGTAADVGHAAVFLMTNPYVTGTVLEVSGGELLIDWIF